MALKPPDMDDCCKKQRCTSGPNVGQVYSICEPCEGGGVFDDSQCDCIPPGSGCWRVQYTAVGQDVTPNPTEFENYYNIPGPGDYFGLNSGAVPEGYNGSVGVLSDQADTYPDTGFSYTPNLKECDGTNCDFSDYYWGHVGEVEVCASSLRQDSGITPFKLVRVSEFPGSESGTPTAGYSNLVSIPGVKGDGTDHCTTTTLTFERDERFPEWGTCTNPYSLWIKHTVVSGRGGINDLVCDQDYCDDPLISWNVGDLDFITFTGLSVDLFYTPSSCGFATRNGSIITYTRTTWFDNDTSPFSPSSIYRSGMVVEGSQESSRAYGTAFTTDTVAKKVEIYVGPRVPTSEPVGGRVSAGATVDPSDEFELVLTVENDTQYIAC